MCLSELWRGSLVTRRVRARRQDVVYIKNIIEANEGVACLFAENGGELVLASTPSFEAELDELIADLRSELSFELIQPTDL